MKLLLMCFTPEYGVLCVDWNCTYLREGQNLGCRSPGLLEWSSSICTWCLSCYIGSVELVNL